MQRDSLMTETLIDPPPPRVLFLPFLALCFANAAEAVEVLGSGYVLARVTTNKTERSLIAGGVYLGMLIGGLISGLVADRRGRSIVLKFALTLATVASVAAAATPNIVLLVICRVAAGIGVGSATPALFALASELAPPGRSAMAVCAVASFWMVGSLFTAGTAYAFFGHASQQQLEPSWAWDARWRGFALAASSLPVLSVLLCCAVVRDPKQRRTNTSSSTAEASGQERVSRTTMEIAEIRMAGVAQDGGNFSDDEPPRPADTRLLQGETLRMRVLPLMLSWAGLNFGYYGLATWVTVLLKQSGIQNEYAVAVLYASANLPGNLASTLLVERVGGKRLLVFSMFLASACILALALVEISPQERETIIVLLAVSFNACATSGWNSLDALTTDSFPQAVRATAFGVLSGSGRVASLIAQFVNGALSEQPHLMLAVTGGCMLLGCIGGMCVKGTARSMARAD